MDMFISELLSIMAKTEIIDLTYALETGIPVAGKQPNYTHSVVESHKTGCMFTHYQLTMSEHAGTHMDAPLHIIAEGQLSKYSIDKVPLTNVMGRLAMITANMQSGLLTKKHVEDWEKQNGNIEKGDIVLINFGWEKYWPVSHQGSEFTNSFPGVSAEAAQYFVDRQVKIVGSDTLSLDIYDSIDFPAHRILLGNGLLVIENLKNLYLLPAYSYFIGLPLKISAGSGSPMRALALVARMKNV